MTDGSDELTALATAFGEAEKRRDEQFFRSVLADDLVFRRANGTRVGKEQFLSDLNDPENGYEYLESEDAESVLSSDGTALVSLRVRAKGYRQGQTFEGSFRNTRLFVKRDGAWVCTVWFNTREET